MRGNAILSIILILSTVACVDRVFIDVGLPITYSVVVDGRITDQPGPYTIILSQAFDTESKSSTRVPVTAKRVIIRDNVGSTDVLSEVEQGLYQTDSSRLRGVVGRVYTLRVELFDGRIYESSPDTLLAPGRLDSVYQVFVAGNPDELGNVQYGFYINFNSATSINSNNHFLWKFTGTFRADTQPEFNHSGCVYFNGKCNYAPLCSGYRNVGGYTLASAIFVKKEPCTCCTCWYNLFNPEVILTGDRLLSINRFQGVNIGYIQLDPWIFHNKVYAEVSQLRLTRQAYDYWRAVKAQKSAANSLFQPITGKIPSNFIQLGGPPVAMEGLFSASGVSYRYIVLTKNDVPGQIILNDENLVFGDICQNLFPQSSTVKPPIWHD